MNDGDALIYAYLLDGKGGGKSHRPGPKSTTGIPVRACFGYIWIRKCLKPKFGWKTKVVMGSRINPAIAPIFKRSFKMCDIQTVSALFAKF
jgi:hypothetical protein